MAVSSAASLRQKVNFYVSCNNLAKMDTFSKSDPFCEVMVKKVTFAKMVYMHGCVHVSTCSLVGSGFFFECSR